MSVHWLHWPCKYWYPILWVPDDSSIPVKLYVWLMNRYPLVHSGRCWGIEWRHLIITWGKKADFA